jgi:hypothetical protein
MKAHALWAFGFGHGQTRRPCIGLQALLHRNRAVSPTSSQGKGPSKRLVTRIPVAGQQFDPASPTSAVTNGPSTPPCIGTHGDIQLLSPHVRLGEGW